jgi:hypothetical protein
LEDVDTGWRILLKLFIKGGMDWIKLAHERNGHNNERLGFTRQEIHD